MAIDVRSAAGPILLALVAQLKLSPAFSADSVFVWIGDDEPPFRPIGDGYVTLWLRGGTVDEDYSDGGGRVTTVLRRRLTVIVNTRLLLDEVTRDFAWLTDQTLGHYAREHAVFDSLQKFWPVDAQQNTLTIEPISLRTVSDVVKPRTEPGWGRSAVDFEVPYDLALDQTKQ